MDDPSPPAPRLLLRLIRALKDFQPPARRRDAADGAAGLPQSAWPRLADLRSSFMDELAFADSYLADDPAPSRVKATLDRVSEMRRAALLHCYLERAYSLRLGHPGAGLQISDDLIAWTKHDRAPLVAVLRGRAFMERGNFLRLLGDPEGARRALARAASELETRGIGDPLEIARHQELLGTLERDCGNFHAASRLLKRALATVRCWGDPYTLQRVLLATALNDLYRDRFDEADGYLEEALHSEEPDSLFLRFAVFNRVLIHSFAGRPHRAYQILLRMHDRVGPSWLRGFPQAGQRLLLWTEGQILNTLGLHEEAVGRLERARELHIHAAQGSKAGQISIELALSHAARNRPADVRRELALGLQLCAARSAIDRHVREALLLLQGTLDHQRRLEAGQIRAVDRRLDLLYRAPLKAWAEPPPARLPPPSGA